MPYAICPSGVILEEPLYVLASRPDNQGGGLEWFEVTDFIKEGTEYSPVVLDGVDPRTAFQYVGWTFTPHLPGHVVLSSHYRSKEWDPSYIDGSFWEDHPEHPGNPYQSAQ